MAGDYTNVGDIILDVRQLGSFTDTQGMPDNNFIEWANQACRRLARPLNVHMQTAPYTITTVAGQQAYALPPDLRKVRRLLWTVGGYLIPVQQLERDEFDQVQLMAINLSSQGSPQYGMAYYAIWDEQVWLYPTPVTSGDTLTLYYYRWPKAMQLTTDTPDIPSAYWEAIKWFLMFQGQIQNEEYQLADYAKQQFDAMALEVAQDAVESQRDRPPRVRVRIDDYGG